MRAFTRFLFVGLVAKFEFAGFRKQKNTESELMTVSIGMVRMTKSRRRKNQSECTDLPQDYLAI